MKCNEAGCEEVAKKRGFCERHYLRMRRAGRLSEFAPMKRGKIRRSRVLVTDKPQGICRVDECLEEASVRGLCRACYIRLRKVGVILSDLTRRQQEHNSGQTCEIHGCSGAPKHDGLCSPHYHRKLRYGDPTFLPEVTKARGKRKIDRLGYAHLYRPGHPLARKNGYAFEHRIVMSEIIGRDLLPNERVHHRRSKSNNDPENLELWVITHPAGQRVQDLVEWAHEILRLYPPQLLAQLELPLSRGVGSQ